MGFDFIVIAPLLPSHCGFSFIFGCGVYFLVSSSVLLSMIVQQLVVIPVLSQEGVYYTCFKPGIGTLFFSSVEGFIINVLDFTGHMESLTTTQTLML